MAHRPLLAAWARGPLRDALWITLGAALTLAAVTALLAFLPEPGVTTTPGSLIPPAAPTAPAPGIPALTAPPVGDRG